MKSLLTILFLSLFINTAVQAREISITVHKLDTSMNVGESIGVIVAKQTTNGVMFTPYLRNLHPGDLQFTVNENVGCQGKLASNGKIIPGMAAGNAIKQLPMMHVNIAGEANQPVLAQNIKINDILGKTVVLSMSASGNVAKTAGQDRVACGSLETYNN